MRRRMEAQDQLLLLAGLAGAAGYEPPASRLEDILSAAGEPPPGAGPDRAERVTAFIELAGGDLAG